MKNWAKNEIELYKQKNDVDEYTSMCLDSALRVYEVMCDEGHSGFSWGLTSRILESLLKGDPLTPITGEDDEWNDVTWDDKEKVYQNKRRSQLFKHVAKDGTISYSDNDRVTCVDENGIYSHFGFVSAIAEQYIPPITFPTFLNDRYYVHIVESLYDKENGGDFDTVAILNIESNSMPTLDINRYFKESEDDFVEVNSKEYLERTNKNDSNCECENFDVDGQMNFYVSENNELTFK